MHIRFVTAVAAFALAACSSGTRYIIVQETPRPAPVPAPVRPVAPPAPVEPLEVLVGRPVGQNLYVQTNRAAYVAIFDVAEDGSVEIVHPTAARQRLVVSGMNRLSLWWPAQRSTTGSVRVAAPSTGVHYIYALASERPLRLNDSAFVRGNLVRVAGLDARTARSPYLVMRALAKRFVPTVSEHQWAEDVYQLASRSSEPVRIARAYCRDGTVWEIPEEMADRAWCGSPTGSTTTPVTTKPSRPDSVKSSTGRRYAVPGAFDPIGRGLGRIRDPQPIGTTNTPTNATPIPSGNSTVPATVPAVGTGGNGTAGDYGVGNGNGRGRGLGAAIGSLVDSTNGRGNAGANGRGNAGGNSNGSSNGNANGNANGNGNGNNGRAIGDGSGGGRLGNVGRGNGRGTTAVPVKATDGVEPPPQSVKNADQSNTVERKDDKAIGKTDDKTDAKADAKVEKTEAKVERKDEKADAKVEAKSDPKVDVKADVNADVKADVKADAADAKTDAKSDDKAKDEKSAPGASKKEEKPVVKPDTAANPPPVVKADSAAAGKDDQKADAKNDKAKGPPKKPGSDSVSTKPIKRGGPPGR